MQVPGISRITDRVRMAAVKAAARGAEWKADLVRAIRIARGLRMAIMAAVNLIIIVSAVRDRIAEVKAMETTGAKEEAITVSKSRDREKALQQMLQ